MVEVTDWMVRNPKVPRIWLEVTLRQSWLPADWKASSIPYPSTCPSPCDWVHANWPPATDQS